MIFIGTIKWDGHFEVHEMLVAGEEKNRVVGESGFSNSEIPNRGRPRKELADEIIK